MVKTHLFGLATILTILIPLFNEPSGASTKKQILASTVTISIVATERLQSSEITDEPLPIPYDEYRPIAKVVKEVEAKGLGTVVRQGGEFLVVTHDHWSLLDRIRGMVRISDWSGDLLIEMKLTEFKEYIRYRDGGTLVLEASDWIVQCDSTFTSLITTMEVSDLTDRKALGIGDIVEVVQQAGRDSVALVQAQVEQIDQKEGKQVLRLQVASNQPFVAGDSGGGVWHQGEFLGNVWTAVIMKNGQTGAQLPTDQGVAAIFPDEYAS